MTPGNPFLVPFSLFLGRLDTWNWGPPTPPPPYSRGDCQTYGLFLGPGAPKKPLLKRGYQKRGPIFDKPSHGMGRGLRDARKGRFLSFFFGGGVQFIHTSLSCDVMCLIAPTTPCIVSTGMASGHCHLGQPKGNPSSRWVILKIGVPFCTVLGGKPKARQRHPDKGS